MKKRILIISGIVIGIILVVLLTVQLVLSASFRKITVVSGSEFVETCPRYARPGQEITVTTVVVSDGDVYVKGADGEYVRPGIYVFTMPDTDVQLNVTVIAYSDGA